MVKNPQANAILECMHSPDRCYAQMKWTVGHFKKWAQLPKFKTQLAVHPKMALTMTLPWDSHRPIASGNNTDVGGGVHFHLPGRKRGGRRKWYQQQ
jgi:hypothetical protein